MFKDINYTSPATQKAAVSYDNVLDIISQQTWYSQNIHKSHVILHAIIYGMYHDELNAWF